MKVNWAYEACVFVKSLTLIILLNPIWVVMSVNGHSLGGNVCFSLVILSKWFYLLPTCIKACTLETVRVILIFLAWTFELPLLRQLLLCFCGNGHCHKLSVELNLHWTQNIPLITFIPWAFDQLCTLTMLGKYQKL